MLNGTYMTNTEIASAVVAHAASELTATECKGLFLPENIGRALEFTLAMFKATALGLQTEAPHLPVKTNLSIAAAELVNYIESTEQAS